MQKKCYLFKIINLTYFPSLAVDRKVKKYIDDLMTHKGVIKSEADFPH